MVTSFGEELLKMTNHEGMWFNSELPGFHCPQCGEGVKLEELANVSREKRTEYARILLVGNHLPPTLLNGLGQKEKVSNQRSSPVVGDRYGFFPVTACSG
jgi:hypothetical protein